MTLYKEPDSIIYINDFYRPPPTVDKIVYPLRLGRNNLNSNFKHQSQKINTERRFIKNAKHALEDYSRSRSRISTLHGIHYIKNNDIPPRPYSNGMKDENIKKTWKDSVQNSIENYLSVATFHGLRYVGKSDISCMERFFWISAFTSALVGAIAFILQIFVKYDLNPLITSIDPIRVPSHEVPFPAVTICSMNSVMKNESRRIIKNGTATERNLLEDICNFSETGFNPQDEEISKFENYFKFIKKVQPPCKQSLKVCSWRGEYKKCDKLFRQVLTDDGICCTFNQLPMSYILKDSSKYDQFYENDIPFPIDDWNTERGYGNENMDLFPFRSIGPGAHLGLTVVLDAELKDYYCSSTVSAGFKVLLHSPLTIPQMKDHAFFILPGFNTRLSFAPIIYNAIDAIRDIDIKKRHCYFNQEKYLKNYKKYSERNCKMECFANNTLKRCGCAPFYLHTNQQSSTCSKLDDDCVERVKQMMEMSESGGLNSKCGCLPSCVNLDYQQTLSYGKFVGKYLITDEIIQDVPWDYFVQNMGVLKIFFISDQFQRYTKGELYGFSEFLSSIGGLLGLFVGFSSLSVVELFYHFSLRIFCMYVRSNTGTHKKNTKLVK